MYITSTKQLPYADKKLDIIKGQNEPNFSRIHLSTFSRDPTRSRDLTSYILRKIMQRTCETICYVALVFLHHACISTWSCDHHYTYDVSM